jgi:hypothetical protein
MSTIMKMTQEASNALKEGKEVRIRFSGQNNWVTVAEISFSSESNTKTKTQSPLVTVKTGDKMPTLLLIAPEHVSAIYIRDKS